MQGYWLERLREREICRGAEARTVVKIVGQGRGGGREKKIVFRVQKRDTQREKKRERELKCINYFAVGTTKQRERERERERETLDAYFSCHFIACCLAKKKKTFGSLIVIILTTKIWNLPNFGGLKPLLKWLNYQVCLACSRYVHLD